MKRIILVLLALLLVAYTVTARDYWGLRNINTRLADEEYERFNAHCYAWSVSWARTEMSNDEFFWETLDNSLEMTDRLDGEAVLVVSCNSSWACDGETRAPDDLDRLTPLADDPPEEGYSEDLYDFVYHLVEHIVELDAAHVPYLRFVNEPEYNWVIGRNWEQDVEDYIRCLRTFYIAAHTAADDNDIEVAISHGGFNLVRSLARSYYRLGEEDEALQDSMITLLQSRFERHTTRIRSWEDVTSLVQGRGGMPPTYWADVMAGQTEWLDWFDVHYHFKPRFIFDELRSFEETVQDSGGELRPWLAAEAAMQLAEGGLTDYEERFHAGDMARKWILGMAFGLEGICTPMTGYPPEHFFGLYDNRQQEYLSAQTYRFLRSMIQPENEPEDLSENIGKKLRFSENSTIIDVLWGDALFDTSRNVGGIITFEFIQEQEFDSILIFNVLGEQTSRIVRNGVYQIWIGHEPVIFQYFPNDNWEVEDRLNLCHLGKFQLFSVYPNPFNSAFTVNYNLNSRASVGINLYSVDGAAVWSSILTAQLAGQYEISVDGSGLTSGVYLLSLKSGSFIESRKIILIR